MPPEEWGLLSIDPELLEGLPENEYRELCERLRREQVKRWNSVDKSGFLSSSQRHRATGSGINGIWIKGNNRKSDRNNKHVTFLLDSEGNPKTFVCGEPRPKERDFKYVSKVTLPDEDEDSTYGSGTSSREPSPPYDNDGVQVMPPMPPPPQYAATPDYDDEEERLNQLLLESRLHIYNSEREKQRERDAWLARKKNQLKERHHAAIRQNSNSSLSSLSSVSSSSPPSSPTSRSASVSPEYRDYQEAALLSNLMVNRPESPEVRMERICEIAKRARNQHRRIVYDLLDSTSDYSDLTFVSLPPPTTARSSSLGRYPPQRQSSSAPATLKSTTTVKATLPSRPAIVEWFQKHELPRGAGIDPQTNQIATWFHGIISRGEAERLLAGMPVGSYLVRVSEKIWGYAISYRTYDRFRHFLVQVSGGGRYQLLGSGGHVRHASLSDLVKYHRTRPISKTGKEYLLHPCPQTSGVPDYLELFGEGGQQSKFSTTVRHR